MEVWRICRSKYETSAFSGIGAERTGGRWNYKGIPMVYTSERLSLAALELFVHVPPGTIPRDLVSIRATLPDAATVEVARGDLPANWQSYPAPHAVKEIGSEWFHQLGSLAMVVPSVIVPSETNILLNPMHPEFKKVKIFPSTPFHFDPRMFGK